MSFINLNLLTLDYIVILLSIIIIIFSFWRGFINSILGILTWIGSIFITIYLYNYLSEYFFKLLMNISFVSRFEQFVSVLSILIAIPLIFLISLFILKRVRRILSKDLDKQILGLILDKIFGVVYGLAFSYIIFSTILYFTNNSDLSIFNNFYIFLIENSNLLKKIFEYNENIYLIYSSENVNN